MFAGGKIIKAININQHSTEFLRLCAVTHVVDPCWPTGAPTLPTWTRHPYHPWHIHGHWLSVTAATCPIQGKLWSKISIFIILTRKIRPEARGFAFARAGGCDDLNHLRFAPV